MLRKEATNGEEEDTNLWGETTLEADERPWGCVTIETVVEKMLSHDNRRAILSQPHDGGWRGEEENTQRRGGGMTTYGFIDVKPPRKKSKVVTISQLFMFDNVSLSWSNISKTDSALRGCVCFHLCNWLSLHMNIWACAFLPLWRTRAVVELISFSPCCSDWRVDKHQKCPHCLLWVYRLTEEVCFVESGTNWHWSTRQN